MATEDPGSPRTSSPRNRPLSFLRPLVLALELPVIPVAGVFAGGGIGYLIDSRAHTGHVFTILFGALGVAGGLAEVIRRASREE